MSKKTVEEIVEKFKDKKGDKPTVAVGTRKGTIEVNRMELVEYSGVPALEVYLSNAAGDPHYRIFNPPVLIEDPQGDIELPVRQKEGEEPKGKKKFRRDPLAAVLEVIAGHNR
jgi:hypothetical protein